MLKYYELETPLVVNTEAGNLEYYSSVKRLCFSLPSWLDSQGQKCRGKTVSLPIEAFRGQAEQVKQIFNLILGELENAGGDAGG